MHSMTESLQIIETAQTVELTVFSPDSDLLATVEIPKDEAVRLILLPLAMKHHFHAVQVEGGRVLVEAVGEE